MCGSNVTAIEIDPVVHRFAKEYFGLRKLRVIHQDGRKFAQDSGEMWDIIIHDVFSGGSVPESLFTLEMWEALKRVLQDDGVLAVVPLHVFESANPEFPWILERSIC
jgi:spermidine synthase